MHKRLLLTCCAALAACATAPSSQLSETETRAIEQALHKRLAAYADANMRFDTAAVLSFWADVPDFTMAGDGTLTVGYRPWADHLRGLFKDFRKTLYFETFNAHPYVLSRDAAMYTTEFRWGFVQANNDTLRGSGSWSYLLRRFRDDWKVVHSAGTHLFQPSKAAGAVVQATDLTDDDKVAIASAVEARVQGYVDAARRKDVKWFLDFWADTDDFVLAGDGNLVGRAGWADQVRQAVANTREILDFEFFNGRTYVLARDAAVHTTQYRWGLVTMRGDTMRSHGSWSYVFKNLQGEWRVVHSAGTHLSN